MVFVVVVGGKVVVVTPFPKVVTLLFWAQVYLEELHQPKGQYSVELRLTGAFAYLAQS